MLFRASLALVILLTGLSAQTQTKVLPAGMGWVEGPSVYTYPFGRATGAIQLLYDADQITLSQGLVTGMRFRQSQISATQTHPGYTKQYKVTAYTVLTNAQSMVADLASNVGSATGQVVFQGPLTLPPTQVLTTQPAPFGIAIPFTTPYVFDGTQGNLLLLVETDDTVAVTSGYRLDAVNFSFSTITGLTRPIDTQGCVVGGNSLSLSCNAASVIVGGNLTQTFTASSNGAFPFVFGVVGFDGQMVDLTSFGMPGCTSWPITPLARLVLENPSGGYPSLIWSLPNTTAIEGYGLVSQALGINVSGLLADSVTSNGIGSRIGGVSGPTNNMGMSFRSGTGSWFKGSNGVFIAVVALEGVFP